MRPVIVYALAALGGCSFDGHPTGGDGALPPDARDGDGPRSDARADAVTPDAMVDAIPAACPAGYVTLGTSPTMYRIVDSPTAPWLAAAADCNDDDDAGGFLGFTHLAVVGSEAERTTIVPEFTGNRWIGLTDELVDGVFVWVTAEPTAGYEAVGNQPPWEPGEPNGGVSDNCVRFKNSKLFEDKPCTDSNKYLCECDRYAPL